MVSTSEKPAAYIISTIDAEQANLATIDSSLESKLVRKQDIRVLPMVFLMYFLTFLDRTNLGNARIAGMEKELNLGTYGFNIGACLYYAIYLVVDVPASLSVKKFGFRVIPLSCIAFGVVTIGTAYVHNSAGFYAVRLLLGLTESFQLPGLSYLISRYYRRHEVTVRICFFTLGAAGLSGGFGGLLASGLLRLGSVGNVKSWRVIFLIEGVITVCVGIISLWLFPADPSETQIYNEEERQLAMNRLFRDQPAILDHKEKITWRLLSRGILNVNVLVGAWIYTCNQITVQGLAIFTPTILRLNYPSKSSIQIQLLSSAPPLASMVFAMTIAYITMKTRKHGIAISCCASLCVLGYGIWLGSRNPKVRYAAVFLNTAGGYGFGPLVIGWTLSNAAPDTAKNVANAAVSAVANIGTYPTFMSSANLLTLTLTYAGSIVATWSYINTDAKNRYKIGNSLNTATAISVMFASLSLVIYQTRENRKRRAGDRDYRLDNSAEELASLGHLHPNFLYIH
ncbi:hypothetical protein E8E13_004857 [Curvularia kusanoi]|uniref:Major facilitator superfamily (MFS) profile domain-containing protein n=1 Tax=Curvularia kusanoi TaxID=90978 RepID=A0A9P4W6B6_CURKU|nr:hypothetical protein E8E13_004857 [Curvularia kusanoi]